MRDSCPWVAQYVGSVRSDRGLSHSPRADHDSQSSCPGLHSLHHPPLAAADPAARHHHAHAAGPRLSTYGRSAKRIPNASGARPPSQLTPPASSAGVWDPTQRLQRSVRRQELTETKGTYDTPAGPEWPILTEESLSRSQLLRSELAAHMCCIQEQLTGSPSCEHTRVRRLHAPTRPFR